MSTPSHGGVIAATLSFVCLALVACASTELTSSWTSPDYNGPALKKLLVMGVSNQPSLRRTFEDGLVEELKGAGVDAVASYNFIPEGGQAEESRVSQAVKDASADGVLITRLVRVDVKVIPTSAPRMGIGYYGGYAMAYGSVYDSTMADRADTIVLETTLYGVDPGHLLWSGTTQTFDPKSIKQEMPGFAKIIIGALQTHKLV